ncbi:integrase catalytic domain-containing protein [Trichonephila inaurata madagascariensis]|uniref:Integrase catalytic domain-containing protein n=1 Tax=Trichonephila inaurata madagascariensis TaxID=2747483 RepID=A0A8X6XKC7_9ARAC|nr:integrase catalytic domain-containing protein [Trichonephila inaurata madagascariensis]
MPYLDENGLIRLGGRLEFCNLFINEKHPLILPKNSWLITLIVRREHNKVLHGGTTSTLAQVRSNYWIPKGRQLVKKVIRNCFSCRKYLAKPILISSRHHYLVIVSTNHQPFQSVAWISLDLSSSITSESCKNPISFYLFAELPEHFTWNRCLIWLLTRFYLLSEDSSQEEEVVK